MYDSEQERLDARMALLASVVANCNRDPKRPAFKVADFMPQRRPSTAAELAGKCRMFAAAFK